MFTVYYYLKKSDHCNIRRKLFCILFFYINEQKCNSLCMCKYNSQPCQGFLSKTFIIRTLLHISEKYFRFARTSLGSNFRNPIHVGFHNKVESGIGCAVLSSMIQNTTDEYQEIPLDRRHVVAQ